MKLLTLATLWTVSLLILSGCGASPKPSDKALVDASLPTIELTKNGVFAEANAIAFEWKSLQNSKVNGIYIFKKSPGQEGVKKGYVYYDTIENRFATHYVDTNIKPNSNYSYAFKTFSKDAESLLTQPTHVKSLPVIDSVSWIHSINGMPRTAKIIWRPHTNQKVKAYIVERKTAKDEKFEEIGRVEGRLNVEYIDTDLDDNKVYQYRVRVYTFDSMTSGPSKIVKVMTKALPTSVGHLSASQNIPKEIHLKWSKSLEKDFAMYYLYRSESKDDYELIAKLHNNTFIDKIDEDDKKYYYRVSVVDQDGLESKSESTTTVGSSLGKPKAPISVEAALLGSKVEITWSNTDERSKKYIITRKEKTSWLKETLSQFNTNGEQKYLDLFIKPDTTYTYTVYAVDKNSIISNPSKEVKIKTPESDKIIQKAVQKEKESIVIPQEEIKIQGETIIPNKDLNLNEI